MGVDRCGPMGSGISRSQVAPTLDHETTLLLPPSASPTGVLATGTGGRRGEGGGEGQQKAPPTHQRPLEVHTFFETRGVLPPVAGLRPAPTDVTPPTRPSMDSSLVR